jgi:hypothetical protein
VVDRSELVGGNVAHTNLETFEDVDGTHHELVSKSYAGKPAAMYAAREVVVAAIGQALGARVPVTVLDPGDSAGWSIYMELMEGQTAMEFAKVDDYLPLGGNPDYSQLIPFQTSPSGRRLGLLDLLVSNVDRHSGNWLIDEDGQVSGIDHSHVHLASRDDYDSQWLSGTFTDSYLREAAYVDADGIRVHAMELKPIGDLPRDEAVQIGQRLRALLEHDEILKLLAVANDEPPLARNGVQYAEALLLRWRAIAAEIWGAG